MAGGTQKGVKSNLACHHCVNTGPDVTHLENQHWLMYRATERLSDCATATHCTVLHPDRQVAKGVQMLSRKAPITALCAPHNDKLASCMSQLNIRNAVSLDFPIFSAPRTHCAGAAMPALVTRAPLRRKRFRG